jgi:hypothetical protein
MQLVGGLKANIKIDSFPTLSTSFPGSLDTIIETKGKGNNLFNRFLKKVKNSIKDYSGIKSLNPVLYLGCPNGYEAFVPYDIINYNGHTDPVGDLILPSGAIIRNVILDGQYANVINQNRDQIVQLNSEVAGKIDLVTCQRYVPLQVFYVIKGEIPVQLVTINGQTYYVIEADKINSANIAGFYTYEEWIPKFVEAINTPGTYAAALPIDSPVYQLKNIIGTVAFQTKLYDLLTLNGIGERVLVLSDGTIIPYGALIPYGIFDYIMGSSLKNYIFVGHVYNLFS